MPPTPLNLGHSQDDFDIDLDKATSPSINIQAADRFPASPWNEYDTDWKFNVPAEEPSNQYTPSYGSYGSFPSHSPSWAGRDMAWPEEDYMMDERSSRRGSNPNIADDYNPNSFDHDIVVGEMDTDIPQVSFTPAMDSFPSSAQHSPGYSGAGSPSSPRSEPGQRSRASSSSSSVHRPYPFDNSLIIGQKPPSPPAIVIPDDSGHSIGLSQSHPQNSGALDVSIHIVPSTPVGGLENQDPTVAQAQRERFSDSQSGANNTSKPHGWPNPGSHPPTPQFRSSPLSHNRSASGSLSTHTSPRLTPGNIMDFALPPPPSHSFTQHRSPALSATSSLHNSPLPPPYQCLTPSPADSPRHHPASEEYFLPEANPGASPRPRASSAGNHPPPNTSALGLGSLTLNPNDMHHRPAFGTTTSAPPMHHYDGGLHPQTATLGSFLTPGGADLRRSMSERTHRRGVKSEDLRSSFGVLGVGPIDPSLTAAGQQGGGGSLHNNGYGQPFQQTDHYLLPPRGGGRPSHIRHSSLGTGGSTPGSPAGYPLSSHNYTHHSARSSPYPSPHASPAGRALHLPEVGPGPAGGGPSSSLGLSVFDTYGISTGDNKVAMGLGLDAMGMQQPSQQTAAGMAMTTNPPKKLVTTKATHDASVSRRKNEATYHCPIAGCGSTFTRSFNLKGHMRSHMEERPFKCKWPGCGKGFARQHDCKRHESLHLNVRPYTCAGCKKTFARMDALNRHRGSDCVGVQQEYDLSGDGGAAMGGVGGGRRQPERGQNMGGDMDGLIM